MSATKLLRDSTAIALAGIMVGLAANAWSPRGLTLRRDYFPAGVNRAAGSAGHIAAAANASMAPDRAHTKRGLPAISHEEAVALFRNPAYVEQRIVFVDARDEKEYLGGHIPGARPFNHYRPELHTADIMAIAPLAERIVVYCGGGDCEDSELAALDLVALGVPESKVVIYTGGIAEWTKHHLPLASVQ